MAFKIGPYTVTRGAIIPFKMRATTNQKVSVDGDGGVVVTEVPYREDFLTVKIRGTNEEMEAIKGFIENGVRFSGVPFTVTDEWNNTYYVRYWGDEVERTLIAPGLCEMELVLRKEI